MKKQLVFMVILVVLLFLAVMVPLAALASPEFLRERIAIDAQDDSYIYNGADLIFFSNDHSTRKARIDGATGVFTTALGVAITPQTAISVTDASVITPTGSIQPLTSAGNVTATLDLGLLNAGSVLILYNNSNTTIAITDTGTIKLSSNISLDQYDSAQLYYDGTNVIQLGESDN